MQTNSSLLEDIKREFQGAGSGESRVSLRRAGEINKDWPLLFGTSRVLSVTNFLVARCLLAATFVVVTILSAVRSWYNGYYLIYLTRWSLILETVYVCLAAYTTFRTRTLDPSSIQSEHLPYYVRAMYLLWNLMMPASVLVCLAFWTLLNPIWKLNTSSISFFVVFEHFLNMLLFMVDFFLNRNAFHLKISGISFCVYGALYSTWSYIHFLAKVGTPMSCPKLHYPRDECPIYNVLDWHHPVKTIILLIGVVIVGILLIFAIWLLSKRRDRMDAEKRRSESTEVPIITPF